MNMNRHAPIFEGKPLDKDADYTSEGGAYRLAGRIRAFWNARGFSPQVWVERLLMTSSPTDERERFIVKSDMVGGRPI